MSRIPEGLSSLNLPKIKAKGIDHRTICYVTRGVSLNDLLTEVSAVRVLCRLHVLFVYVYLFVNVFCICLHVF